MKTEPFWKTDPSVLVDTRYIHRFFPSSSLTMSERLNAIVRLGAFVGVGLAIVQKAVSWVLLPIVAGVITMAWDGGYSDSSDTPGRVSRRERDFMFLVKEIVSGNTRDIEHRHRVKRSKRSHSSPAKVSSRVYQDLDTNIENLRNERATMRKQLDSKIGDAPGFARKMMRRDEERFRANGRKKYSRV